jgi:peptidoglycan/LPS O-acetylase OafA/YrhL
MTYRRDIQVIRGLSVLLVVLYHLEVQGFQNGYLGVDVFFVLSGYLMALLCTKGTITEFYGRRLKRLLPAYLVTLAATTLVVSLVAIPVDANQRFDRLWLDLIGSSNIAFWLENSYFDSAAFKPLLNLWSLGVELQFYLIAPFILPFLAKRKIACVLLIAGSLAAALVITTVSPKTSFFMMPLRLWEFLLGALAAWHPIRFKSIAVEKSVILTLIAACAGVIFLYPLNGNALSPLYGHPGVAALLIASATALLISTTLNSISRDDTILFKTLGTIGDYSYSIYLVHFPAIALVNYAPFGGTRLGFDGATDLALILAITIVLSYVLTTYVERIRFSGSSKRWIVGGLALTLGISLIAPTINSGRFTKAQNEIFAAWQDRAGYRCGKLSRILSPTETVCTIGTPGNGEKILLLGNSHADSIKTAFSRTMEGNGLSTYFYVSNAPLMSEQSNAHAIANDIDRLSIGTVVIHYSPSFYQDALNIERLRIFLDQLKERGTRVLFISPVPTYEYHIPKALYQETLDPTGQPNTFAARDYLEKNAHFFSTMSALGVDERSLYLTHPYLCPLGTCSVQTDGKPLYFDDSHLTLTGSDTLTPLFAEIANRLTAQ